MVSPLNRLLRPYAAGFFSSYGGASPVPDFPVDRTFFDLARPRTRVGRIVFLGGSQGARFINDFALEVAPALRRMGIAITHQTGEADFSRVQAGYRALHVDADTFAFDSALTPRMASADFAVSRAGGGTVWELAANGLPALFVPFPHAARDHQYRNARFFADRRLGFVARQSELDLDLLLSALRCDLHGAHGPEQTGWRGADCGVRVKPARQVGGRGSEEQSHRTAEPQRSKGRVQGRNRHGGQGPP